MTGPGGLALLVMLTLLVLAPVVGRGQTGPIRDRGRPEALPSTVTGAPPQPPARFGSQPVDAPNRTHVPGPAGDLPAGHRPRPDSAPVVLRPTATPAPIVTAEPPRRPVRARQARRPALSRVWPVAPGTFELSQRFGCVPQLFGYYPTVPGCPAAASSYHNGLDLAASQGTPIYAAASGWVTVAGRDRAEGLANTQIVIEHDGDNEGYRSEYYHWITSYVEPGDYVQAGDLIAEVGSVGYSTGPHLHFTVVDTTTDQAIDPARWLPSTSAGFTLDNARMETDRVASGGGRIVVTDYIPPTSTPTSAGR